MEIENFEDLIRIGSLKQLPANPGCPFGGNQPQVWWFSKTFFFHLISQLPKIFLKFR